LLAFFYFVVVNNFLANFCPVATSQPVYQVMKFFIFSSDLFKAFFALICY